MFSNRVKLIPRYNWDYGFLDLMSALSSVFQPVRDNGNSFEKVFDQTPLFTTSGRMSLYVILKALNLPPGAHIGVPLYCCPVVFDVIKRASLKPKFIDIELSTYTISPEDLARKRESLAAVVAVHMFGHPVDINQICDRAGDIPVIEDCAQSLFSKYKNITTGALSTASFFSFRSGKYISAGEGSILFAKEPRLIKEITQTIHSIKKPTLLEELVHCISTYIKSTLYKRPWYGTIGYPIGKLVENKLNLTAKTGFKCAAIRKSNVKIISRKIDTFKNNIVKQRENALYLLERIKLDNCFLPFEKKDCYSNYFQFALRFENKIQRDFMSDYLLKKGIDSAKYLYDVIDIAKKEYNYQGDCPITELCAASVLIIPHYYTLSRKELDYIIHHINNANDRLKELSRNQ